MRLAKPLSPGQLAALQDQADCTLRGGVLEISLSPHVVRPRDLMKQLEPYGPVLLDNTSNDVQARIKADLRRIALRTLLSATLTIPVLVFVWSPLHDHPGIRYDAASFALSTVNMAIGYPLYRSSISLMWYLREIDLGLLASVSIISAYVFSVVAFGFEVAEQGFAEPLFETVGLLITLIFLGRTLQVYTRRLACSMLKGLTDLQPSTAVLVVNGKESTVDVRSVTLPLRIRIQPD